MAIKLFNIDRLIITLYKEWALTIRKFVVIFAMHGIVYVEKGNVIVLMGGPSLLINPLMVLVMGIAYLD